MTVGNARYILQEEIEDLSDKEVQHMINRDFMLCDALLDVIANSPDNLLTLNVKSN